MNKVPFALLLALWVTGAEATEGRYALVVGIKGYPHFPPDKRLKYADEDAKLFANFLSSVEGGGFPKENIKLLLNQNANRVNILKGIQWLQLRANSNDTVYVYFAGHGVVNDLGQVYLMPFDAEASFPDALGIPAKDVFGMVKQRVGYKNLVFFIDACHAGATLRSDGAPRSQSAIASELQATWRTVRSNQAGVDMALLSASSAQQSWEDSELGHGLFTWYLIEALKGAASDKKTGVVKMGQAYRYILDKVEERSRVKFASLQSPTISSGYDPNFVLSITKPPIDPQREELLKSLRQNIEELARNQKYVRVSNQKTRESHVASYDLALRNYKEYVVNSRASPLHKSMLSVRESSVRSACNEILKFDKWAVVVLKEEITIWQGFLATARSGKDDYPPASDWIAIESELAGKIASSQEELNRWTNLQKEEAKRFCPPGRR